MAARLLSSGRGYTFPNDIASRLQICAITKKRQLRECLTPLHIDVGLVTVKPLPAPLNVSKVTLSKADAYAWDDAFLDCARF